ncbi:hypothetical protein IV04_16310 [Serratia sp. Ag1]|nr:hypothetical protein JV45_03940 [Serratia sp. Ag2]KFK97427.1 hypothetical protein IV04_16310 [Serratia sp. Ag1]
MNISGWGEINHWWLLKNPCVPSAGFFVANLLWLSFAITIYGDQIKGGKTIMLLLSIYSDYGKNA